MDIRTVIFFIGFVFSISLQTIPAASQNSPEPLFDLSTVSSKILFAQELKKLGLSKKEIFELCENLLKQELANQGEPQVSKESSGKLLWYGGATLVALLSIGGLVYWFCFSGRTNEHSSTPPQTDNHEQNQKQKDDCVFCRVINRQAPGIILEETENMIAIEKVPPRRPVDCLIIPKTHVVNIQDIDYTNPNQQRILADVGAMAQRLSQRLDGNGHYSLRINNGRESYQTVFHLHAHFSSPDNWK